MKNNIIISDISSYNHKLENIKKWSFSKLHFLADFDNTLTKKFVNWKSTPSLISVLRSEKILWDDYSKKAYELFDFYHKIEIDPNISMEEKKLKMYEWRSKHLGLIVKCWLKKSDIEKAVNFWILEFRDWVLDFFEFIKNTIPFIIISANWLWDESIRLFLQNNYTLFDNIDIVSNIIKWDDNWYAIWYSNKIVHSFNKDETVLESFPEIFEKIKKRTNIILLGDSLGDPFMVNGFDYENVLKIWFLNDREDELLEEYKKLYDVVITWDWDFAFINDLLKKIKD